MSSASATTTTTERAFEPSFTPVGGLIRDAWSLTKDKWKAFLKIMAVVAGIEILLAIALGAVLTALGVTALATGDATVAMLTSPLFVVAIIAWAIPAILFGTAGSIATYRVAYEGLEEFSVLNLLKSSFKLVLPLILVGLITSLLVLGGFFLLIIPGIIFSILFVFAPFEVMFHQQSPMNALKRSASVVSQNFGTIFVRWLAFVGVMIVFGLFTGILDGIFGAESIINQILQLIGNFIVAVFSTIYFTLLYKQVRLATDASKSFNLLWVVLASIIGWVIGLVVISSAITALSSYFTQQSQTEMDSFDPSLYMQDFESMEQEYQIDDSSIMMDDAI